MIELYALTIALLILLVLLYWTYSSQQSLVGSLLSSEDRYRHSEDRYRHLLEQLVAKNSGLSFKVPENERNGPD